MMHAPIEEQLRAMLGNTSGRERAALLDALHRGDATVCAALGPALANLLAAVDGSDKPVEAQPAGAAALAATQQLLRDVEARFQALSRITADYYWEQDAQHRFTRVSEGVVSATGRDAAWLLGKTRWEAFADAASDLMWREHIATLEARQLFRDFEFTIRTPDRGNVYISASGEPAFDANGEFAGYRGIARNITRRVQAQQRLRESMQLTETLIEAAPMPMVVKNRELQITLVNSAYERMFGIQREQVLNKPIEHQRAELTSDIDRIERDMLQNPGVQQSERRLPLPNGTQVDCIITKSTYVNAAGEVGGIITAFTDITSLKHTEANLIRARQQAEAAMKARSQFLANMSHEIRTPMNGVLGMASLLSATPLNDEQREFVGTIQASGESLLKILNDILDFSKIDVGKIDIEHTPFDLHSRLAGIIQLFAASARQKALTLKHEIAADVPKIVRGDPVRISQALSNLIGNAIKFTATGGVTAGLSVAARGGDALTLRFDVQDTGIGIAANALQRVFEPFSQADDSTTRQFGGTGLGLTISRQLVQLMGGEFSVTSTPGAGSCFSFTVKVTADASGVHVANASAQAVAAATQSASTSRTMNILLAEDNLVNQTVATAMLKKLGCNITLARNGREAIAAAKARHFDLILMDCHMPDVDGFAATAEIRALERDGQPRHIIVAQTANAMEGDRESCIAAGMDDYVSKPFSTEKLAGLIERWRNDQ